jgi:UDP-glucuronate 4-epimerase
MAILVTGAAGFIGYHTCKKLLSRGESVIGIDNVNDYYQVKLKHDRITDIKNSRSSRSFEMR